MATRKKVAFQQNDKDTTYSTVSDSLTIDEKVKILDELGQPELIELFKEWKPRPSRRRRTAPLDQRVSIAITNNEKVSLDNELKTIKNSGEKITASQFIRNRALGSVDVHGWKNIAVKALEELEELDKTKNDMRKRKRVLAGLLEETDDQEDVGMYEREMSEINHKLDKLTANNEKRNTRLTGRMSLAEAETVKWRAQRLCISSSDYLRLQIFGLEPNSHADAHMSVDARRRFYVSIIDVSNSGFGDPPTIYSCTQCGNYLEEIERLRDRVKQLETFS